MSETVLYIGKLKPVEKLLNVDETFEERCKRILKEHNYLELNDYCDSWEEMLCDELYDEYVIVDEDIYKIVEKNYRSIDDDVFEAHINNDGTISYEVMYYNGGCSFNEAIEEALQNIK